MTTKEQDAERQRRYRQNIKMENETRGSNPEVYPTSYKKDIPVQAWMESRYLATLSEWLDRKKRTRKLSEVMQEGIRILVDHLVRTGEINMIDDSVAAQDMLVEKYGIVIRRGYGARGKNNTFHNAVLTEERRKIAGSVEYIEPKEDMRDRIVYEAPPIRGVVSDDEYKRVTGMTREEARRSVGEGGPDMKEVDKKLKGQMANMEFDENGVYLGQKKKKIGGGITINVEENLRRMKEADEKLKDF